MRKSAVRGLIKTLRPHQWVKNLFVLAPMFFHKDVFLTTPAGPALNLRVTGRAFIATAVFCLLAGAVYTINDLVDVEADRVHPVKRNRPIASGAVPEALARAMAAALVARVARRRRSCSTGAFAASSPRLLRREHRLQLQAEEGRVPRRRAHRVRLRAARARRRLRDGRPRQRYMLACTALLALFLGFGKRRHELEGETRRQAARGARGLLASASLNVRARAHRRRHRGDVRRVHARLRRRTRSSTPTTSGSRRRSRVFGIVRFLMLVSGRAGRGLQERVARRRRCCATSRSC